MRFSDPISHDGAPTSELPVECLSPACLVAELLLSAKRHWHDGRLASALEAATAATFGGCQDPHTSRHVEPTLTLVRLLAQVRHTDEALAVLDEAESATGVLADRTLAPAALLVRADVTFAAGDFDRADKLATTGLAEAQRCGQMAWAPLGHFVLAQTALRRGHLSAALRYTRKLKQDAVFGRDMLPAGKAAWAVVQLTKLEKGHHAAATLGAELLASDQAVRGLSVGDPVALPWLVRLMSRCGMSQHADRAVRIARQLAEDNPGFVSLRAVAGHAAGLRHGDVDELRAAAATHVDKWARAMAAEDVAAMQPVAQVPAQQGPRRTRPLPQSRPRQDVPELTDTEYDVAQLTARGFTNGQIASRLFLSPHTIAFHLRKIFRKLGVESRVQLAGKWNDLSASRAVSRPHVVARRPVHRTGPSEETTWAHRRPTRPASPAGPGCSPCSATPSNRCAHLPY